MTPGPARVLIVCPTTGREVSAVLRLKPEALEMLKDAHAFRCDQCGQIHSWRRQDAWLESARQR